MRSAAKVRYLAADLLRLLFEFVEDLWFDGTRNVRTSGNVSLLKAGLAAADVRDSEFYQPARPRHIRRALREINIADVSGFSYVDLGSGKGRSLFVAAELPFRQIAGVERSRLLHEQATENIGRFRSRRRGSRNIASLHQDATEFIFPKGDFVLYMFNPFGPVTMQHVLDRLSDSLREEPRHVVIILLWPRCEDQVAQVDGARLICKTREYQIFAVHSPH